MTVSQFFLSTSGRISRSTLWLGFVLPTWVLGIIAMVIDAAMGLFDEEAGIGVLSGLFSVLLIYPSIAVSIKRFHDRNRSGWFLLLMLVPILNIWPAIELYFIRGTRGDNNFGLEPLSK